MLLGSAMGLRCACRGEAVVVWYCDVDMAEDANLTARATYGPLAHADLDPPE